MPPTKSDLDSPLGSLFLMMIFTGIWAVICEIALEMRDYGLTGAFFGLMILYFLAHYIKFQRLQQILPVAAPDTKQSAEDRKRSRQFLYIFGTEGLAILVVKNILVNVDLDHLFIPSLALIVGIHF